MTILCQSGLCTFGQGYLIFSVDCPQDYGQNFTSFQHCVLEHKILIKPFERRTEGPQTRFCLECIATLIMVTRGGGGSSPISVEGCATSGYRIPSSDKACQRWNFDSVLRQIWAKIEQKLPKSGWFSGLLAKALNGIQWEVAHPLSLNYGAPVGYMDATMCARTADTYACIHRCNGGSGI